MRLQESKQFSTLCYRFRTFGAQKTGNVTTCTCLCCTHCTVAAFQTPLFFLAVCAHTHLKPFSLPPHQTHTHTHTHYQLLSICELRGEAMKECNDATWQPIKPERDEDAIRLSPALELPPTEQMEGARGERVLFLEGEESFQGERWFPGQHLTRCRVMERRRVLSCVISCVVSCWAGRSRLKIKFPSGGEINAAPPSSDISSYKIIVAVHSQRETHVFKVLRRWRQQCSRRHD